MSENPTVIPSIADKAANSANSAAIDLMIDAARYPYIVAWGKWLGFTPETVQKTVAEAEADDAPPEAIQKINGRWSTLSDIVDESNRQHVAEIALGTQRTK